MTVAAAVCEAFPKIKVERDKKKRRQTAKKNLTLHSFPCFPTLMVTRSLVL